MQQYVDQGLVSGQRMFSKPPASSCASNAQQGEAQPTRKRASASASDNPVNRLATARAKPKPKPGPKPKAGRRNLKRWISDENSRRDTVERIQASRRNPIEVTTPVTGDGHLVPPRLAPDV